MKSYKNLKERAVNTLQKNIEAGDKYIWGNKRCIVPSRGPYLGAWNWDSAFHANTVSRWDPELAYEQMEIFFETQCDDGKYSREFSVSGTKGMCMENDNVILTDEMEIDHNKAMREYRDTSLEFEKNYLPQSWRDTISGLKSGHGGMDGVMLKSFFEAVKKGEEMPIDVYDAASWMSITCLSESSIAKGGVPMEIPDFTCGKWIMRENKEVMDLEN